ncbi:MAG: VCBS repeat-containing protein [Cyclobacteriaceae bacterium]|nr:VCBS repeat-containing protein [Cyclobacteriaceae bacterium]
MGSLLFDVDGDQDLDLYVVSGGSAWHEDSEAYQDRLYINSGSWKFAENSDRLPKIRASGSCVIAGDYDRDGDLDLFVGGRLVPNKYPLSPQSYLLENEDGKFVDKSETLGDQHGLLGMVTSALWTDVNNDNALDLIVVGEWMQITVLLNLNNSFVDKTEDFNLSNTNGWWNSINGGDFDNDGDIDYLVGNYGLNSFFKATVAKPVEIYAKDFDNNGFIDPVVTHYIQNESYIVHPRNTIIELIPSIENRFFTFESYGNTPFKNSFTSKELVGAIHLTCKMMQSVILENVQGKKFIIHELPMEVQFSPVFGTLFDDFNFDNRLDIMIIGNSLADETVAGYYDASYGNILINKGNFQWEAQRPSETNLIADGDKKALARMIVNGQSVYVMTENDGYLQAYTAEPLKDLASIIFEQNDWYFTYKLNGIKTKKELYHGSGFLSSSSRIAQIPKGVNEIEVYKYDGSSSTLDLRK